MSTSILDDGTALFDSNVITGARRALPRADLLRIESRDLRYGSFESVTALAHDVLGFVRHWNCIEARPFRWTFSGRFVGTPVRLAA
ncbi:MAG: hypothetical protein ABSC94_30630 [Polyangiaceae bacterium]